MSEVNVFTYKELNEACPHESSREFVYKTDYDRLRGLLRPFAEIDLSSEALPKDFAFDVLRARGALGTAVQPPAVQLAEVGRLYRSWATGGEIGISDFVAAMELWFPENAETEQPPAAPISEEEQALMFLDLARRRVALANQAADQPAAARPDADGDCTRCGLAFEDPREIAHECPPGFGPKRPADNSTSLQPKKEQPT